jgi:hypothetical protein
MHVLKHVQAELSKAFGMMTIADGLTTQLTNSDIVTAQRLNTVAGGAGSSGEASLAPSAGGAGGGGGGGGWRDRIEKKLNLLGASTLEGAASADVGVLDAKQRRVRVRYEVLNLRRLASTHHVFSYVYDSKYHRHFCFRLSAFRSLIFISMSSTRWLPTHSQFTHRVRIAFFY